MKQSLNDLIERIHTFNVKKGYWANMNNKRAIMLIICEMAEAVEAHRNRQKLEPFSSANSVVDKEYALEELVFYENWYESEVKGSVAEEMADIVIRTLDLGRKVLGKFSLEENFMVFNLINREDLSEWMLELTKIAVHLSSTVEDFNANVMVMDDAEIEKHKADIRNAVSALVNGVKVACSIFKIDLLFHVNLKIAYNENSPSKLRKLY